MIVAFILGFLAGFVTIGVLFISGEKEAEEQINFKTPQIYTADFFEEEGEDK